MTEKYSLLPINPQQLTPTQTALQRMSGKHSDFEIQAVNTIRPPDIDMSLLDYEYYNLLLARAEMIGRLLLEWRTQQALEYKKKNKQYTNEEIFKDDQMVYLLAPHSSALQTDTTKFKQDFIMSLL